MDWSGKRFATGQSCWPTRAVHRPIHWRLGTEDTTRELCGCVDESPVSADSPDCYRTLVRFWAKQSGFVAERSGQHEKTSAGSDEFGGFRNLFGDDDVRVDMRRAGIVSYLESGVRRGDRKSTRLNSSHG